MINQYVTAGESRLPLCCTIAQCSPSEDDWIEKRPEPKVSGGMHR